MKLKGHCSPCWARGYEYNHGYGACNAGVAKEGDKEWEAWHRQAFKIVEGFCYFCLIPQVRCRFFFFFRFSVFV
jgi:hypothetical protein